MLRKLGYHDIDYCINGAEAVEMERKKTYDLIFMDINMPIMEYVPSLIFPNLEIVDLKLLN